MANVSVHLDAEVLAALLSNPAGHAALLAHLREDCEQCDAFLAAHGGPGLLDGAVDAGLARLSPGGEAALHEAGFARALQALAPKPKPRRRGWAPFAAAGALALAGAVFLFAPRPPTDEEGLKGAPVEVVELQAVWQDVNGALAPVGPGAQLPAKGALLFRARSPRAGKGLLLVQRGAAAPELLHPVDVAAGLADLRSAEGALGFSLQGEAGPVTVWLIVREGPTPPSFALAVEAVHSGGARGLALGRFEVRVAP